MSGSNFFLFYITDKTVNPLAANDLYIRHLVGPAQTFRKRIKFAIEWYTKLIASNRISKLEFTPAKKATLKRGLAVKGLNGCLHFQQNQQVLWI